MANPLIRGNAHNSYLLRFIFFKSNKNIEFFFDNEEYRHEGNFLEIKSTEVERKIGDASRENRFSFQAGNVCSNMKRVMITK